MIVGVRSLTAARRRPNAALRERMSTPHKADQAVRQLAATGQQTKHDLHKVLDRYGVVS